MSVSSFAPIACPISSGVGRVLAYRTQPPHRVLDLGAERHAQQADAARSAGTLLSAFRIDTGAIETRLGPGSSSCVSR